jgi:urea transport system permease protein
MRARVTMLHLGWGGWRSGVARLVAALLAIGIILHAMPAVAQAPGPTLETALEKFTADSFGDTEAAIAGIIAAAPSNAQAILEALANRRLLFSAAEKSVVYQDAAGATFDAKTAKAIPTSPADASPVRINNRLRGVVEAALGSMTLMSPDATKRVQAADSIFKSRDVGALPSIDTALAREKDSKVTRALLEARAAVMLTKPDASSADRVTAIDKLSKRGDKDAINLLRGAAASAQQPEVKQAAEVAIANVERKLRVIGLTQDIYYGLSLGSVLLLAAIGLAITFGVMGIINMAHGEMVMLGAYTTYVVQQAFKIHAPAYLDFALPLSIPLAFLVAGLVGIAIERGIIRFLYGRPLETLLATWGVSLILQQAIRNYFGASNVQVSTPEFMSGSFEFAGLAITYGRLWIIIFTLVVFACLLAMLRLTPLGLQMRAVTQNRRMASSMGIPTARIDAMTFGLGSGIAGIAGVALSQIDNIAPNLGQSYIIDSFMVVVFGGVGNLWGTLVSAFALGIANKLLEPFAGAVLGKILILVLLILFIQKRPRGLFALKGRAVEA